MSWLRDSAVIYQIFIDRFAGFKNSGDWDKPQFLGGNIRGIINKFDYLLDLGVDAIWLSPFFQGVAYHDYHTTDFLKVDKHFGTEDDLVELLNLAHAHGLKVICDFAPNHCSTRHPFFVDALNSPSSQYRNWFYFNQQNEYLSFLHFNADLAKFNLDNPATMKYIIDSAKKWLSLGLDGFRIDHAIGFSRRNLQYIVDAIKRDYPEAVLIGELKLAGVNLRDLKTIKAPHKFLIWLFDAKNLLYKEYDGILDGFLDFKTMEDFHTYVDEYHGEKVATNIQQSLGNFKTIKPVTFLDDHDDERFLFKCGGDVDKLKKAASLQLSLPSPTIIYYGTEIGMTQQKAFSSRKEHADLFARQPMKWSKSEQNLDLLKFYKKLITGRKHMRK